MKLSEKITELRKRNGWSQEQLAVKLDGVYKADICITLEPITK